MNDTPRSREPLGALRIVLAIIGGLAVLLSGACSISVGFGNPLAVLFFGGPPFALGLLVVWMALRLGRGSAPPDRIGNEDQQ